MKTLLWINRVLLTLLSLNTAIVKLLQMEFEMVIFRNAGLPDVATIAFGVVQLAGGLLLIWNKTTKLGAWVMVPTFVFATGVLFVNAMIPFGVFSLLFVAMAVFHGWKWGRV